MTRLFQHLPIILCAMMLLVPRISIAQGITINELYNSSGNDEWIELLVVQDSLDIRSWDIRDFSSTGTAQAPLSFTTNALWSLLAKGTIIVVGRSEVVFAEDTDPSDYLLVIKSNNALYFSGTPFLFAGASDAIQIRNASDTHIFGVSWGAGNSISLAAPKAHFSGTMSSGNTIYFNEDTQAELTTTTNWTFNTATQTRGAANGGNNTTWINTLRSNTTGDGSGSATVDPDTLFHGNVQNFLVRYYRDTAYTLTDMRIVLPFNFAWSHDTADVSFTNMSATKSMSGDTVYLNSLTMTGDSTVITISNLTAPDSTAYYPVRVQTKALNNYANVSPSPQVVNFGLPVTVSSVKTNDANGIPTRLGQLVTISGVVNVANEFGGPSYIQDNSGGIAIFGSALSANVVVGDEVVVSGKLDPFNGLSELTSPYLHEIVSSGNTITPLDLTASEVYGDGAGGVEAYEGLLVRLNSVVVRDTFNNTITNWTVSGSGTNYRLTDGTGNVDVRVDNGVNFANTPAPQSQFDIIGVVSQFKTTLPYIGGYQVMPRSTADILADGPIISTTPYETDITATSFRINWTTIGNGTSRLRYGLTSAYELGTLAPDNTLRMTHAIDVTGLSAAMIYHVQAFSVASAETSFAADLLVSTSSPAGSTGQVNVYFNKSVNTSLSSGEAANANQDLISRVITRIDNAKRSIDAALYSLSANNQGDLIATALINAKNRGVKVRVICEYDNRSSGGNSFDALAAAGITIITDRYDAVWFGQGLMHNKFFVFDYRGGAPESIRVWTGSWNPTMQGTTSDRQNAIEIQDVALAGAYTAEFNEMWGSSTDTPNATLSRFGARKVDNVPHNFNVNGVLMSVYFSPEDKTTTHIRKTIAKAQSSVGVALLTFTRQDLADSVIARKNAGKKTRVILDNNTDATNKYSYMQSAGIDIRLKGGSGLLHHKYALIDAEQTLGTPYVVTGSHNWSNNAENSNDENTMIIQNTRVANLYLQEFAARYYEAGGTDSIFLSSAPLYSATPTSMNFGTVDVGNAKQDSFTVSNIGTASLSVSSVTSSNALFTVTPGSAAISASGSGKFYVTFTPLAAGAQNGSIVLIHNASGSPDTVLVQGTGNVVGGPISLPVSYAAGWNMLSLPVEVTDSRKNTLFPWASSEAYRYLNGYQIDDTLDRGAGYWLKLPGDTVYKYNGLPITADTIAVSDRWNMIGSLSNPLDVSSITPVGTTVSSIYYGFSSGTGYTGADTLKPGYGYWVKVIGAGQLIRNSAMALPKGTPDIIAAMNSITLTDEGGRSQTLYFGPAGDGEIDMQRYEMPPFPPKESFSARFASGRILEAYPKELQASQAFQIQLGETNSPISIRWSIDCKAGNSYTLSRGNSINGASLTLTPSGEAVFSGLTEGRLILTVGPKKPLPEQFSLSQNYPNPFNPRTTIPFALPQHATVSLSVINVLGQTVETVLANEEYDAGFHTVSYDASHLSSGIYYYKVVASTSTGTQFHQTNKFVLLK